MRLRTFRWPFAISFLLLVLSACSAVSAQHGSTSALGTTGLRTRILSTETKEETPETQP